MKRTPKKWLDYTNWTVEQHIEHLRTNPDYLAYYAKFNPDSIEKFITDYAKRKHNDYTRETFYEEHYESYQMRFYHHAERYLEQILQKKLFNLQCQWRACLIELPLVDIIPDFDYWSSSENIRSCPFIPPITEAEIDLCIRFLNEKIDWGNCNDCYMEDVWQDYDRFKNQLFYDDHEGEPEAEALSGWDCVELPDLYQFFDIYQGTTHLINLPNIRGEKEEEYRRKGSNISYEARVAESKANGTYKPHKSEELDEEGNPIPYVYVPDLDSWDVDKFIEAVEDERTKALYKAYEHYRGRNRDLNYEGLDEDLKVLKEFDEPIPIDAYSDWRIAVRMAAYRFRQKKAAEMLPYVYDTYLLEFDEEMDVDKIIDERVAHVQFNDTYSTYSHLLYYKNEFLDGREALTGKRDFDYLND